MMLKSNRSGFTLVELMIVVFLFTLTIGVVFGFLTYSNRNWRVGEAKVIVQQEARRAMDEMVNELRQTKASVIAGVPDDGGTYPSIGFKIPTDININTGETTWSDQIQYTLNGRQIIRSEDISNRVVANDITGLSFSRDNAEPNIINISITAQKTTFMQINLPDNPTITLNTEVRLRNI